jgi:hypothetical protein
MGIPILKLADLLALRDGEDAAPGADIALRNNPAAQFTLLEHRLLALAFTMPSPGLPRSAPLPLPTDPAVLEGYVTGTLPDHRLAAYEDTVRGNPQRFAELIDFKNDFFGRSKSVPSQTLREPPTPDRETLGVLALRSIEEQIFLAWRPEEALTKFTSFLRAADYDVSYGASSKVLQSLLKVEAELRDLQNELNHRIEVMRKQILMTMEKRELPPLVELRDAMGELVEQQELVTRRLRDLRGFVAEILARRTEERLEEEEGGPWSRGYEIDTRLARLDFSLDRDGSLYLRIADSAPEAEFTWIRPGVTFAMLEPKRSTRHVLGRIDQAEALLLISAPGERSQVVRVTWG